MTMKTATSLWSEKMLVVRGGSMWEGSLADEVLGDAMRRLDRGSGVGFACSY